MEVAFTKDEIKSLEHRLSVRFDIEGIYYNGTLISWNAVDEFRASATRTETPSIRILKANIVSIGN